MIPIQSVEPVRQSRPKSMRVADLANDPAQMLGNTASAACLHYCAPTHGGWGVIRTAMLVPEMHMLFVCPAACGRHGAIAAIEQGCKDRVRYLCIEEHEIVLGSYEDEIRQAVPVMMAELGSKPRAMMIVVSCIDDLLGTNYDQMLAEFEATFRIPFRLGRMNPISMAGKLPPGKRIQRDMYDFLNQPEKRDNSIGILGTFQPFSTETELHGLLRAAGMGPLRHISESSSFESFQEMGATCLNIVARPEGLDAAKNLEEKIGTPYVLAPVAFSEEDIVARYAVIANALSVQLEIRKAIAQTRASAAQALRIIGNRRIAIDGSATCSPFSLARSLCESGFSVREIFTEHLHEFERPSFEWLSRHVPDLIISSPIHPDHTWKRPTVPTADIAIGFTSGYLSGAPLIAPVVFDEGLYGCHGMMMMHRALEKAVLAKDKPGLENIVRAYGLVV